MSILDEILMASSGWLFVVLFALIATYERYNVIVLFGLCFDARHLTVISLVFSLLLLLLGIGLSLG